MYLDRFAHFMLKNVLPFWDKAITCYFDDIFIRVYAKSCSLDAYFPITLIVIKSIPFKLL